MNNTVDLRVLFKILASKQIFRVGFDVLFLWADFQTELFATSCLRNKGEIQKELQKELQKEIQKEL